VHETVSPLTNRFPSVTGIRTLGFGRRRYGRLFLAIAGLLVFTKHHIPKCSERPWTDGPKTYERPYRTRWSIIILFYAIYCLVSKQFEVARVKLFEFIDSFGCQGRHRFVVSGRSVVPSGVITWKQVRSDSNSTEYDPSVVVQCLVMPDEVVRYVARRTQLPLRPPMAIQRFPPAPTLVQ